jgi:hypothetical protein
LLANNACLLASGSTQEERGLNTRTREARDRTRSLRVVVSANERADIEARARATGLSVSAYLRAAGLGYPIKSVLDHVAVADLAKVNGDQGRLGGLLKLWLVDRPEKGASGTDVRRLLERICELQSRLAEIVGRV